MSTPYNKGGRQLCKNFQAGSCTRRQCPFLHSGAGGGGGSKGPAMIGGGQVMATLLKLLLEKAQNDIYVPDQKRLIISNFKASPDIQSMVSSIDFNTASFCDALCTAIADKLGPTGMLILDVSNNQIRSLTHLVNALKKHGLHTNLSALSVENNQISTSDFSTQLQPFPNLQQLVMMGNPITKDADYRQIVRKRLPNLIGLDKQPIQRPPLALPWPIRASSQTNAEATAMALQFVDNYFSIINSEGGLDNVIDKYHPQAVFSFSYVQEQATVKWDGESMGNSNNRPSSSNALSNNNNTGGILVSPNRRPLPSKEVLRDVTTLRVKQSEGNHNLVKGLKRDNIARGRAEVVSKLSHLLYHRSFAVEHVFHSAVNACMLEEGTRVPAAMIVVTMHGYMKWTHRGSTDVEFTRVFDRTMGLVPNPNQQAGNGISLLVSNDVIELRPNADDPLFFADNEARVMMVGRKFNLPPAIAFGCMSMGQSDMAWFNILSELQVNVPTWLLEKVAETIGADNIPHVVNVARVIARKQLNDIPAAVQMLQAAGGNVDAVQ